MKVDYEYVYAIIRVDEYKGQDSPPENKVVVKEIVWDEDAARREVERLNALNKKGVLYFSSVTRLLPKAASAPTTDIGPALLAQRPTIYGAESILHVTERSSGDFFPEPSLVAGSLSSYVTPALSV